MFHYSFTNDLRISNLAESLKKAGYCFVTDTVPTATQDKSSNNNMKTLGFYFNLTKESNCSKEAKKGNVRGVVLNFIKKFQFPNLRTRESYRDSINDGIQLSPMRMIIKVLYVMNLLFEKKEAYLTRNEIKFFLFYNENVAKTKKPDVIELINSILKYRETGNFPTHISTDKNEHFWKQEDRQLREMIKVLLWSGCVDEEGEKIYILEEHLSRDNKADIYEIINYDEYWNGDSLESYQEYMDMPTQESEGNSVKYLFELNNKEFAFECIKILKKYDLLSEENIEKLVSKQLTSQNFKNSFPILIEVLLEEGSDGFEEQFKDAKGRSRYYTEKIEILGKRYAITNNWYYGGQKDVDTRTPFVNWIINEINKKEVNEVENLLNIVVSADSIPVPYNYLLFGAPGTGKSFKLEELQKKYFKEDEYERVTFYPNYSYQNFVGAYKPCMRKQEISYEYIPGPFIRVLVNAYRHPDKNFLLVIEELNRANAAAVFGDLFQLLDRKDGKSEYVLNTSEDLRKYIAKVLIPSFDDNTEEEQERILEKFDKIYIPCNMYIWATMNSADQGVFPMDTAFKRRWDFEYIGVDDEASEVEKYTIPIGMGKYRRYVKWNDLRTKINDILVSDACKVNEDKLLGPFFISKNMLENAMNDKDKFVKAFESKVLMYLFEDVGKMRPGNIFVGHSGRMTFSEICKTFETKREGLFGITDLKYTDE